VRLDIKRVLRHPIHTHLGVRRAFLHLRCQAVEPRSAQTEATHEAKGSRAVEHALDMQLFAVGALGARRALEVFSEFARLGHGA